MTLIAGPWDSPCTLYEMPCEMFCDDEAYPEEKCTDFPLISASEFDENCFGPNILQNTQLGDCFLAVGLDGAGVPVPDGEIIGYWDCNCEPYVFVADSPGGVRIEYIGPQPIVNFTKPWRMRIGGMHQSLGGVSLSINSDAPNDCGSNQLLTTIDAAGIRSQLPGFCFVPFECDGNTITPSNADFLDIDSTSDCCLAKCIYVDPLCHTLCARVEAEPAEFSGNNQCVLNWAGHTGQQFFGSIDFKITQSTWNVDQIPYYECNDFIPFPGLLGIYDQTQTFSLTIGNGGFFTGFCIGNVDSGLQNACSDIIFD